MKVRVETQTDALAALYLGLTAVASGDVGRAVARDIAGELPAKGAGQVAAGRDPYGSRWIPPKDGGRPGVRTGKLQGAVQVRAYGPRILLSASGGADAGLFSRGAPNRAGRPPFPGGPPTEPTGRSTRRWRSEVSKRARNSVTSRAR